MISKKMKGKCVVFEIETQSDASKCLMLSRIRLPKLDQPCSEIAQNLETQAWTLQSSDALRFVATRRTLVGCTGAETKAAKQLSP